MAITSQHFDSLQDFLRACSADQWPISREYASDKYDPSFCKASYADALHLADHGWKEGLEKIAKLTASFTTVLANKIQKDTIRFDVSGDVLDIGRVVTGEPECFMQWETTELEQTGNKVLKIVASITVSASVTQETMIRRGAAIAALVECMELSGYRIELVISNDVEVTGEIVTQTVTVKRPSDQLQLEQLVFTLAHPSMLRRFCFRFMESKNLSQQLSKKLTNYSYGRPVDPIADGDIKLGCLRSEYEVSWQSDKNAIDWLTGQLRQFNVKIEE